MFIRLKILENLTKELQGGKKYRNYSHMGFEEQGRMVKQFKNHQLR